MVLILRLIFFSCKSAEFLQVAYNLTKKHFSGSFFRGFVLRFRENEAKKTRRLPFQKNRNQRNASILCLRKTINATKRHKRRFEICYVYFKINAVCRGTIDGAKRRRSILPCVSRSLRDVGSSLDTVVNFFFLSFFLSFFLVPSACSITAAKSQSGAFEMYQLKNFTLYFRSGQTWPDSLIFDNHRIKVDEQVDIFG